MHGSDRNRIWCAVVQLACELMAWTQMLGFAEHPARRWEPKRPAAAALHHRRSLARHGRALIVHLAASHAWADLVITARAAITAIPAARPD